MAATKLVLYYVWLLRAVVYTLLLFTQQDSSTEAVVRRSVRVMGIIFFNIQLFLTIIKTRECSCVLSLKYNKACMIKVGSTVQSAHAIVINVSECHKWAQRRSNRTRMIDLGKHRPTAEQL